MIHFYRSTKIHEPIISSHWLVIGIYEASINGYHSTDRQIIFKNAQNEECKYGMERSDNYFLCNLIWDNSISWNYLAILSLRYEIILGLSSCRLESCSRSVTRNLYDIMEAPLHRKHAKFKKLDWNMSGKLGALINVFC